MVYYCRYRHPKQNFTHPLRSKGNIWGFFLQDLTVLYFVVFYFISLTSSTEQHGPACELLYVKIPYVRLQTTILKMHQTLNVPERTVHLNHYLPPRSYAPPSIV